MVWTPFFGRWYNGRVSQIYDEKQNAGRTIFVSSVIGTDAQGYGGEPRSPYATLAQAYATATTGNGDKIILMPGHVETIATAAWLVIAKTNLTIFGIGNGDHMPTFTFEAGDAVAGVDIDFNAANTTVQHVKFVGSEDGATGPMDINAAGCSFIDCIFEDDGAANTVNWFNLDANADETLILNCRNWGTDTAGNDAFITITGAADHVRIEDLYSHGDFAAANIELTAAATDLYVSKCYLENANAVDANFEGFAGCTGMISDCRLQIATDGETSWINTLPNMVSNENYGNNTVAESAMLTIDGANTPLCTVP